MLKVVCHFEFYPIVFIAFRENIFELMFVLSRIYN